MNRKHAPRFCGCGSPIATKNKTGKCAECIGNNYNPSQEEIAARCAEIRAEKVNYLNRGHEESQPVYCPKVYSLDTRNRR
jgi:hypothetical protein